MKVRTLFLIIIFFFIGMTFNIPTKEDDLRITQKKLEEFQRENNISIINENMITIIPSRFSKVGKSIENIIDEAFDILFSKSR